jgi:hypothetical protein
MIVKPVLVDVGTKLVAGVAIVEMLKKNPPGEAAV